MVDIKKMLKRLEEIRKQKLISYRELAKEIGIGESTILRIKDNPKHKTMYETLRKIRKYIEKNSKPRG